MKNLKNIQKGFTLIELMLTVAIVGILSGVALPAYQDYTVRAQVAEALNLANGAKIFLVNHYTENGDFPEDNREAGFPGVEGSYVSSIEIQDEGLIVATFGNKSNIQLAGETLSLEAVETETGNLLWNCLSSMQSSDKVRFLPRVCREQSVSARGTGE